MKTKAIDINVTPARTSLMLRKRCKGMNHPYPWFWKDGVPRKHCELCGELLDFSRLDTNDPIRTRYRSKVRAVPSK